jgi:metal-responsive CopG/Arc/MetJ family transcriptional regulator
MGKAKIKLEKDLFEKIKKYADMSGYSSPEEFIVHCLEKEISQLKESDSEEEIKKKLKGLGYIS